MVKRQVWALFCALGDFAQGCSLEGTSVKQKSYFQINFIPLSVANMLALLVSDTFAVENAIRGMVFHSFVIFACWQKDIRKKCRC